VQTGVKSFGCENNTTHESPIQSWKLIGPSVVSAWKSGASSPIFRAIRPPCRCAWTIEPSGQYFKIYSGSCPCPCECPGWFLFLGNRERRRDDHQLEERDRRGQEACALVGDPSPAPPASSTETAGPFKAKGSCDAKRHTAPHPEAAPHRPDRPLRPGVRARRLRDRRGREAGRCPEPRDDRPRDPRAREPRAPRGDRCRPAAGRR